MKDERKTKAHLITELNELRERLARCEKGQEGVADGPHEPILNQLLEREKELKCIYALSELAERDFLELPELFRGVLEILPASFQYPEKTVACLTYFDETYTTPNYKGTDKSLCADLHLDAQTVGRLEVGCFGASDGDEEDVFLREEQNLLDVVAERLGKIVERIEIRKKLAQQDALFQKYFNLGQVGMAVTSPEKGWLHVNPNLCSMLGYTEEELRDRTWEDLTHPEDLAVDQKQFERILSGEIDDYSIEKRFVRKDGGVVWTRLTVSCSRNDGGSVDFVIANLVDISDRKEAESRVTNERARLMALIDGIDDVIYVSDPETYELVYVNDTFKAAWGDDVIGKKCYRVLQGFDAPCPFCTNDKIFGASRGETYYWEFQNEVTRKWYRCADKAIQWYDGRMVRFELASDITELKTTGSKLNETLEKLEKANEELDRQVVARTSELSTIIDGIPGMVFYKDVENRFVRVNQYTADLYGMAKEELEGKSLFDLHPPDQAKQYYEDDLRVIKGGQAKINVDEIFEADGQERWINTSKMPFRDELGKVIGVIAIALDITDRKKAEEQVRLNSERLRRQNWVRTGQSTLSDQMRGQKGVGLLCDDIVATIAEYVKADVGALFLAQDDRLCLAGKYAYRTHPAVPGEFAFGEGLVGQAARDGKIRQLEEMSDEYIVVGSGLGQTRPNNVLIVPFRHAGEVAGVMEIASLKPIDATAREFIESVLEAVGISIYTAQAQERLQDLLEETQRQSEELQTQQEELRTSNEELEEQATRLRESEERLRAQQEEMEVTNEELEEKNELLERQKREVEHAQEALQIKAEELALASKYKSEFLANMSHELRTPLNSLLLLSRGLTENREGNLSADQVECADVIYQSGSDLLQLINEILDLSKIEAGQMQLKYADVYVQDIADATRTTFRHMAEDKGLDFRVVVEEGAPESLVCDRKRHEQIIRNLVGNAIKFTEEGSVAVVIGRPGPDFRLGDGTLPRDGLLSVAVSDTGVGIEVEQQKVIFEAFQQVDGGIARKYNGTGLGLSISRELAALLGGEIHVDSTPGEGSTFTLYVPIHPDGRKPVSASARPAGTRKPSQPAPRVNVPKAIEDDREDLNEGDRVILLVEDDVRFAEILARQCREKGFKVLNATSGEAGLDLAASGHPSAIILDLKLPGMDGWGVLERIKENPDLRHIPVHIVSAEEPRGEGIRRGAIGELAKPVNSEQIDKVLKKISDIISDRTRRVLVVEDDDNSRRAIVGLIGDSNVQTDEAVNSAQVCAALRAHQYDCMVLDLKLGHEDGRQLIQRLQNEEGIDVPPIIVYTGRELTHDEEMDLRGYSDSIIIKDVKSEERLLDEVALFLHRVVADMPAQKRGVIETLHDTEAVLRGKKVLIVDDDMRTVFALSNLLASQGMCTIKAENGQRALEALSEQPDIDLVLMDIMMPVMDGYETMRRVRKLEPFQKLPIIALTAKAMKGDRASCIQAGASDYLPKPVDQQRLISMMRVWLYK